MDTQQKKQLHHKWTKIRAIQVWYLVVVFLCMAGITAVALRHNNQQMVELRQAVYQADENNGNTEKALRELRQYVYGHMNTDLSAGSNAVYPPIQLKHTYERLLAAQQEGAKQANAVIYSEAQSYCERLHPESYSGGPRVPCIRDYVASKGVQVPSIPDSLYKFDFVSPTWSPDFAGWSVVLTVLVFLLLIARLLFPYVLKKLEIL